MRHYELPPEGKYNPKENEETPEEAARNAFRHKLVCPSPAATLAERIADNAFALLVYRPVGRRMQTYPFAILSNQGCETAMRLIDASAEALVIFDSKAITLK